MGRKNFQSKWFYNFSLEDRVPEDHLLRAVAEAVDFSFVRGVVRATYSHTGTPSVSLRDPDEFRRVWLEMKKLRLLTDRELYNLCPEYYGPYIRSEPADDSRKPREGNDHNQTGDSADEGD